jgi:hypothetical protein
VNSLAEILEYERVLLGKLTPEHYKGLRQACAEDPEILNIHPNSMLGEHFDQAVEQMTNAADRCVFAVIHRQSDEHLKVVGMTSFINPDEHGVVEFG